jgi:hypothetical protein
LENIKKKENSVTNLKLKSSTELKNLNATRNELVKKANNEKSKLAAVNAQYKYSKTQLEKNAAIVGEEQRLAAMYEKLIEEQKKQVEKTNNTDVKEELKKQLEEFVKAQEKREADIKEKISNINRQSKELVSKVEKRGSQNMKTNVKVVVNRVQSNVKNKKNEPSDLKRKSIENFSLC